MFAHKPFEELLKALTKPTKAQEWLNSPEVTAQCEKWRKEEEDAEKNIVPFPKADTDSRPA